MKVLFIYKYSFQYNLDHWFNDTYAKYVAMHPELGIELKMYGPELHKVHPDYVVCPYTKDITCEELQEKFNYDVVLINTKSRMFEHYSPYKKEAYGCILPSDFSSFNKVFKVVLEQDSHYESNGDWYKEIGINLLLQRHHSQSLRNWGIKTLWHPFSVDENVFKPGNVGRIRKVCFAGHITAPYPCRRQLCDILKKHNLIDVFEHKEKVGDKYIQCLQQYEAHLSTPSVYNITAAKNFEIMSSQSVLITPQFSGLDLLFPKDSFVEIDILGNDIVEKVKDLLGNLNRGAEIASNGRKCILERHTHSIRTRELLEILKKEL